MTFENNINCASFNQGVELTALGGIGRFGGNCLLIRDLESKKALAVDCGARFLGPEGHGYRFGIPPVQCFQNLGDNFLGFAITHGHEDHIGALPYAIKENDVPIWAGSFTSEVIRRKLKRQAAHDRPTIHTISPNKKVHIGPFALTWIKVNHSIPDAHSLAIETPAGTVVHSGDFRLELNPVLGAPTDFPTLSQIGNKGVLCLLSDSTLAVAPGKNPGERSVIGPTKEVFENTEGRLFVATFSTHIQRIHTIANLCRENGRYLSILGRSMREKVQLAQQKGLFQLGDIWVPPEQMLQKPSDEQCWLLTGSQGEMGSALWRLAHDKSMIRALGTQDTLLMSARIIPGNERTVASLLDLIADRGVNIFNGRDGRHVSGHGHKEDMSALISATKPQFFVPLHGGVQQLKAHRKVVEELGLTSEQIVELRNGQAIQFSHEGSLAYGHIEVPCEPWVSNGEINFTPQETVAARGRMSQAGVLIGTLSNGGAQITLQGEALGTWNSQPILDRIQNKMTDFLMEHYDLPRPDLKKKLFRIVNDEFRLLHKTAPYLFIR